LVSGVKACPLGSSDEVDEKLPRVVRHSVACPAIAHTADPATSRLRQPLKSEHMTDTPPPDTPPEHEKSRLRRFEDAVHDRLLAAEVAAEEAAGYGSLTAAREAAESAANPEHELGGDDESGAADSGSEHPAE
jgi:hypothetical protein